MVDDVIKVKKLAEDVTMPYPATAGSAGADIRAYLIDEETGAKVCKIIVQPGSTAKINTKLAFQIPEYTAMLLLPRSSVGIKKNLVLQNTVGLLDCDYRGECLIFLKNVGTEPVEIYDGERLVQAVIVPYVYPIFIEVKELEETYRGTGGFGSTNIDKDGRRLL